MRELRHSEGNNESYTVDYTEFESRQAAPGFKLYPVLTITQSMRLGTFIIPYLTEEETETQVHNHRASQCQCQHLIRA